MLKQPPKRFDVSVFVGDVRVVEVHPIAHFVGQVGPFLGVFHHFLTASIVVLVHRNLFADVFFFDTECFFHPQLHGQAVGVPARFTEHLEAAHGFVAAHDVLNGARQHVVNARHTVGRRRTFVEHKSGSAFTLFNTFGEHVFLFPKLEHVFVDVGKIQFAIFSKLHKK